MDKKVKVLIFLPVFNEEENLFPLVEKIFSVRNDFDILVVDDNSQDNSFEVAKKLKSMFPSNFEVIRNKKRKGRGFSAKLAYQWAIENNFDYLVEMDADFSHNPEDILRLLEEAKGYDLVIGSRYVKGGKTINRSFSRIFISKVANLYFRFILGLKIKDVSSGFRCFSVNSLKNIDMKKIKTNGVGFLEEIIYRNKKKLRIKEVPIVFKEREKGYSKFNLSTALHCLLAPWRWIFS